MFFSATLKTKTTCKKVAIEVVFILTTKVKI